LKKGNETRGEVMNLTVRYRLSDKCERCEVGMGKSDSEVCSWAFLRVTIGLGAKET
jgi:hypothetical protein